jgi:cyclopropane fatty-acyl-phospholipid synthase-like methyltransferase
MLRIMKMVVSRISSDMRAPSNGCFGWFATKIMTLNTPSTAEAIRRLNLQPEETFLEIGAGNGAGLCEIAKLDAYPKRIVCVEISERFRLELQKKIKILEGELPTGSKLPIEIHANDCKEMPYLHNSSVDKIFGMNVVYFLDPLSLYLQEFHRVLKDDGYITFGCKFGLLPEDSKEFVNINADRIVSAMEEEGFRVEKLYVKVDGGKDKRKNYIEIKGSKA